MLKSYVQSLEIALIFKHVFCHSYSLKRHNKITFSLPIVQHTGITKEMALLVGSRCLTKKIQRACNNIPQIQSCRHKLIAVDYFNSEQW